MLERIIEPCIGDIVFYKNEQGIIETVEILEGAFFKNGRVSNFWHWKNILTGKKDCGYGNFYKIKEKK
jgi:hypothetical protein